jgi:hypothetical protein
MALKKLQSAKQEEVTWNLRGELFTFLGDSTAL